MNPDSLQREVNCGRSYLWLDFDKSP